MRARRAQTKTRRACYNFQCQPFLVPAILGASHSWCQSAALFVLVGTSSSQYSRPGKRLLQLCPCRYHRSHRTPFQARLLNTNKRASSEKDTIALERSLVRSCPETCRSVLGSPFVSSSKSLFRVCATTPMITVLRFLSVGYPRLLLTADRRVRRVEPSPLDGRGDLAKTNDWASLPVFR